LGRADGKGKLGTPRRRLLEDLKMDFNKCDREAQNDFDEDRHRCRALLTAVICDQVPYNFETILHR
jgi:hypothetical protein